MPVQNRPIEPSAFHELKARVDKMEAEQKRQGRQLVTVDRIVTADLPAPSEGQLAVEASDDTAKYYANGQWREFAAAGSDQYYTSEYNLMSTPNFISDVAASSGFGGYTAKTADEFSSFYVQSTADGSYITRILRLGPQGSIWHVSPIVATGPDCGRIVVQLATIDEDYSGSGFDLSGAGVIEDPDGAGVTWYNLDRQNGVDRADLYQGGGTDPYDGFVGANGNWRFRIMGDAGTALTATPAWDVSDGVFQANCGPGLIGIRFFVDGKNASSSSYRFRLHAWHVQRLNYQLLSV